MIKELIRKIFGTKPSSTTPKTGPKSRALAVGSDGIIDALQEYIQSSGRVDLKYLMEVARTMELDTFSAYLGAPSFVGEAVRTGKLVAKSSEPSRRRSATLLFRPAQLLQRAEEEAISDSLQQAIYPLVKRADTKQPDPQLFAIGRDFNNDLVIPDFAISREHATLRLTGAGYLLSDRGSSNGTSLNGTKVGEKGMLLHDGDVITFARYDFSFVLPATLHQLLRAKTLLG